MRKTEEGIALTERNQLVRVCIGKALIQLLDTKTFEKITITEIVQHANVSRMTFYKYYKTKQEVLEDYMFEIVNAYYQDASCREDIGQLGDLKHICHGFYFFKQYSDFIMTLVKANQYVIIMNAINDYMLYLAEDISFKRSHYDLYYYAGAICNVYMNWVMNGMKESPETMAQIVHRNMRFES